jgi:hypothetical protein
MAATWLAGSMLLAAGCGGHGGAGAQSPASAPVGGGPRTTTESAETARGQARSAAHETPEQAARRYELEQRKYAPGRITTPSDAELDARMNRARRAVGGGPGGTQAERKEHPATQPKQAAKPEAKQHAAAQPKAPAKAEPRPQAAPKAVGGGPAQPKCECPCNEGAPQHRPR